MKTLSTLFLMLTTAVGLASAQSGDYPIAFPKDQDRTYSNRVLSSVGLGACKATVANTAKMYCDMTHRSLVAKAGETVQPIFGFSTDWMHSYAYIDKNKNGQFDVSKPGSLGQLTAQNELVVFSALKMADGLYYNSAGETVHSSTLPSPTFTVPSSMKPGYYMMRWSRSIGTLSTPPDASMRPNTSSKTAVPSSMCGCASTKTTKLTSRWRLTAEKSSLTTIRRPANLLGRWEKSCR